jgi:hypothetical protein
MKRILIIFLLLFLSGCALNGYYEGYNGVIYQKNHDYYYMSNEEFMKNYYHYDIYPNDCQFKLNLPKIKEVDTTYIFEIK